MVDGGKANEVATASAPKNYDKVTYTIQVSDAGGVEGHVVRLGSAIVALNPTPRAGVPVLAITPER